jgi:ribosome-binding factor A
LHFHYDDTIDRASRLTSLINEALADDQAKHKDD